MKLLFLLLLTLISSSLHAESAFEAGMTAYAGGDREAAFEQFKTAAEAGDQRAYGKLGGMYLYGQGTERDYQQAYLWFGIAHANGDRYAEGFQRTASSMLEPEELQRLHALIEQRTGKASD